MSWPTSSSAPAINPALMNQAAEFRAAAAAAVPGRLGVLMSSGFEGTDDLSVGESAVRDLVEQFHLDAHGVSDGMFAALRTHYSDADVVAIMMHLALVDGFRKFDRVFLSSPESGGA